jgi:glycosyltransferase involved in cell wall biosynthesis
MKISVVMPIYNERATLREIVERVLSVPMESELLCVDDGSTDGSSEILAGLQREYAAVRVLLQPKNMGKGAALRRGIQEATGDVVIFKTQTWNTIPRNTQCCCNLFSIIRPMWCTVLAL